jgi:hypothetical protein
LLLYPKLYPLILLLNLSFITPTIFYSIHFPPFNFPLNSTFYLNLLKFFPPHLFYSLYLSFNLSFSLILPLIFPCPFPIHSIYPLSYSSISHNPLSPFTTLLIHFLSTLKINSIPPYSLTNLSLFLLILNISLQFPLN